MGKIVIYDDGKKKKYDNKHNPKNLWITRMTWQRGNT